MSANHTLIIAEAGVNHNGDADLAMQLVEVAAAAGADLVKFQTFSADRLVTTYAGKADYQTKTTGAADGIKRLTPSEARNQPVARKSLVASRAIQAGERFTAENITAKRPGTGISPMRWDEVVGQIAHRNYQADELI